MPPKKKSAGPRGTRTVKTKPAPQRKGIPCPDCDFVAAHIMGLGRHRTVRHGAISKKMARGNTPKLKRVASAPASTAGGGDWLSRQAAAESAGVHYNTIRQWEQSGVIRRTVRPGVRGSLVSASDLRRVVATRGAGGNGRRRAAAPTAKIVAGKVSAGAGKTAAPVRVVPTASSSVVEAQFRTLVAGIDDLIKGLQQLVTTARAPGGAPRRGRPPGSKNKARNGRRRKVDTGQVRRGRGRPPGSGRRA